MALWPRPLPPPIPLGAVGWRRDLEGPRHGVLTAVRPPRGCAVRNKCLGFRHCLPRSSAGKSEGWAWPKMCSASQS